MKETHPEYIIYISNNDWPVLLLHPLFQHSPISALPIQVVNAISIFGNDKIVYLQSKGCMSTANWPLQSFSCFYLVIVFTAGQYI